MQVNIIPEINSSNEKYGQMETNIITHTEVNIIKIYGSIFLRLKKIIFML